MQPIRAVDEECNKAEQRFNINTQQQLQKLKKLQ